MASVIQSSFAKGEISPALYGRVDTAAYQAAAKALPNMIVHKHGGASNRPGTEYLGPVKDHSYAPRLIRFQFKSSDAYILEFGDRYMRVIRDDAHVVTGAVGISSVTLGAPTTVVTSAAHNVSNGQEVYLSGIGGTTELNGRRFVASSASGSSLVLTDQVTGDDVDGSSYSAYTGGGTLSRIYELATPYLKADLDLLKTVQSADVITITHPSYPVYRLSRTAHDNWTLTQAVFNPRIAAPNAVTVSATTTGTDTVSYTVTAVAADTQEESLAGLDATPKNILGISNANPAVVEFTGAHGFPDGAEIAIDGIAGMTELNGRRFVTALVSSTKVSLQTVDSTNYASYQSGGIAVKTFERITNSATTTDNVISWNAVEGASSYFIYRSRSGVFALVGTTSATSWADKNASSDATQTPPKYTNLLREAGDYPATSGYFEQRQVFGGSLDAPDTSIFSQTGSQSNLTRSSPPQADDAIVATLAAQEVNEIRHYVPLNELLAFTSGAEWKISSGTDSAFSAESIKQKPQSSWGSSHLKPIVVGSTVIFVRETQAGIRSFGYTLQTDGYTGSDLTLLAGHLFGQTVSRSVVRIVDWAYSKDPDSLIHVIRSDGSALALTFEQEQEVVAWTPWNTRGSFERVASIRPNSSAVDDNAYFVVKRRINGRTVRYIERLRSRRFESVKDAFFLDCGASYDNPIAITGVEFDGTTVRVTAPNHGLQVGDKADFSNIVWEASYDSYGKKTVPVCLNDDAWAVTVASSGTFEVEVPNLPETDPVYVEGGFVRKQVSEVSGLHHLEGQVVTALADGGTEFNLTVEDGRIELPYSAGRIHVGMSYVSDLGTLKIEAPSGTIQGKKKRVASLTIRLDKTVGVLAGPNEDDLVEIKLRDGEQMGDPIRLFSGDVTQGMIGGWDTSGEILIRQRNPLPLTVLAVIPELVLEDRGE